MTIDIQPPSAVDPYTLRVERLRGDISALASMDKGVRHTVPVMALLATATPRPGGSMSITATWTAPTTNPALGGALLFAALQAVKQQAPGVYAEMLTRLRASDPSLQHST